MTRTYRYPLTPNLQQRSVLIRWLGVCCDLYNAALQERNGAWTKAKKSISRYDQQCQLTEVRAADVDVAAVPVVVARSPLRRIELSFQAFFKRCKAGQKPGHPRFRSKSRYNSLGLGRVRVEGNHVIVPKLGPVKFHRYRSLGGTIRSATISRTARRWWVSFSCDVGHAPEKIAVRSTVGVDLGLTSFAVLSTGEEVENPRYFRHGQAVLARRQQLLSRFSRGHRSRTKDRARNLVGRAHEHVANQRRDFACKLASTLFARFDLVAHEDLAIRGMVHGTLAKSIHDAGWGLFIGALQAKAEKAGKLAVPVDPRGTSQKCSSCGATVQKELSERTHRCACGLVLGRDHNAAINIHSRGLREAGLKSGRSSK